MGGQARRYQVAANEISVVSTPTQTIHLLVAQVACALAQAAQMACRQQGSEHGSNGNDLDRFHILPFRKA